MRGTRFAVPADLLDAVIEFVDVALGIGRIEVPVGSRQVAPRAADRLAAPGEPVECVRDLAERSHLPRDLVDRALRLLRPFVQRRVRAAREAHERVVIGAVAREVADRRTDFRARRLGQARAEVQGIRDAEAEQAAVEVAARLGIAHIDAEMPQAPDAERPRQPHAAYVELRFLGGHLFASLYLPYDRVAHRTGVREKSPRSPHANEKRLSVFALNRLK